MESGSAGLAMGAIGDRRARRQTVTRTLAVVLLALLVPLRAEAQLGFTSGGVRVGVERFDAPARTDNAARPAVLLLHGADGLAAGGGRYRAAARQLAAGGFHVFVIDYFDRTGGRRASFATGQRDLPLWTATAIDAVGWVSRQPGVDAKRIGALGVSLGAAVALTAAAREPRLRAVVDYFGFAPFLPGTPLRLPPTLILHGADDRIVPVAAAHLLDGLLRTNGVERDLVIYPAQGHGFTGATSDDAARRAVAWFARFL